jgi:putative transposase
VRHGRGATLLRPSPRHRRLHPGAGDDGRARHLSRLIRETLGDGVVHRTSRYKNNRIEQDHRSIKQRYYPMRGFGAFVSAARFCAGFEEQRQYFRPQVRSGEPISLAERRRQFRERWATVMVELAAV